MARYIDADALIRVLDAKADMAMGTPKEVFLSVAKMVDYLPPADVVPRAEVAREIFEEIEKTADACIESEWLRGSWFNMSKFKESLAELKNKYAEGLK